MKCGARVALGVAGGYFLGRTKKMKLALMLGGMVAGRRAGGPGELLARGSKLLSSSPEISKLTDDVRGRLLEAGKGAALAVAARQVESLADRVGKRVESLGDLGGKTGRESASSDGTEEADDDQDVDEVRSEDEEDDETAGDGPEADGTAEAAPARQTRRAASSTASPNSRARKGTSPGTAKRTASSTSSGSRRTASKAATATKNGRSTRTRRSTSDG